MNYAALFKGRFRALLSDIPSLSILLIIIAASFYISVIGNKDISAKMPVAVVNKDAGERGEELVNILLGETDYSFYVTSEEEAGNDIAKNKAHGIVVIKKDFRNKINEVKYKSLLSVTVMSESNDIDSFTEIVINDAVKIWMESLTETRLTEIAKANEDEIESFRLEAADIWNGGSLLDVAAYPISAINEEPKEEEIPRQGVRWYAALSLFYLIVGGTWMCNYGSGQLIGRAVARGGNIALLFFSQALPGMIITTLGFIPVLIRETADYHFFLILTAFILYSLGASGMSLVVCTLCGKFTNLVIAAPVITMAASLMSGLLFKLPDWAGFWEIVSVVLPGHWFYLATQDKMFIFGALITNIIWLLAGILISKLFSIIKKNS